MDGKGIRIALCLLIFIAGTFCGVKIDFTNKYQAGRLSACTDMVTILNDIPMFSLANISCVMYHGDAAIKVNDGIFSLDGTKKLN